MKSVAACLLGRNGLDRASQGVVGAGQRLAEDLGAGLSIIVLGPVNDKFLSSLQQLASEVLIADQAELVEYDSELYLETLEQLLKSGDFSAILLSCDSYSQELVPRLAHRMEGCSLADVTGVTVTDGKLLMTRSAYGGKAEAIYELQRTPAVAWLRARSFDPPQAGAERGSVEHPSFTFASERKTKTIEHHEESRQGIPLEDAQIIIAGGRGLGGPEGFEELQKLAMVLGAAVGSSRVACDEGWVPPSFQIGQTGKKVAPELYLAVGISGAAQHLLGMADSKVIAAINTDREAPMYNHCSFGIVEDYRKVIPRLIETLAELKR